MPSPRTSLAGTQFGRAPGERRAGRLTRSGSVGVGRVEPGEADQRPDLAQPLGLDDVGVEVLAAAAGTPSGSRRRVKSSWRLGRRGGGEDLPLRGAQVRVALGRLVRSLGGRVARCALDRGPELVVGPLVEVRSAGTAAAGERSTSRVA